MEDWDRLDRRQQLWLLDRQEERLVESLDGRSRAAVAHAIGVGPAALSPSILLTTPYPPVLLAKLAYELAVPAGLLHPIGDVPPAEEASYRSDPTLDYVLGPIVHPVETACADAGVVASSLRAAVAEGVSRIDLARASGLGYSSYSRFERPRSATLNPLDSERMRRILLRRTPPGPAYSIRSLDGGAVRVVVAARMRRGAAEAILTALDAWDGADLVRSNGPVPDSVALRLDVETTSERARALMEVLSPRPRRRGIARILFGP